MKDVAAGPAVRVADGFPFSGVRIDGRNSDRRNGGQQSRLREIRVGANGCESGVRQRSRGTTPLAPPPVSAKARKKRLDGGRMNKDEKNTVNRTKMFVAKCIAYEWRTPFLL